MSTHSSPLPACFRPTTAADDDPRPKAAPPPPLPPSADRTNLTTCLYHTPIGLFSLTWSGSLFGRSLHLLHHHHHHQHHNHTSAASPLPLSLPSSPTSSTYSSAFSFRLHIKPFLFWKRHGSKKLNSTTQIFWDLTRAKFGSGPEPVSGFYIAVVCDGVMALLVGDLVKEAYSKTKSQKPKKSHFMFLRREHLYGNRVYSTIARIGGQTREISIECSLNGDGRLWFGIDRRRVLQVKRLKWKFRGNERIEVDGVPINISWDVYNWMFEDSSSNNGHAVFMFRFEKLLGFGEESNLEDCNFDGLENYSSFGMNEIELKKMRKSMLRTARSSSSSSISSSASMGSGSSVMEWASSEETDLAGPIGFSLLVYAWKR